MIRAVDDEGILEGRVDEAVLEEPAQTCETLRKTELDAGTAGIADIVEEADVRLRTAGGLKQDVVVVDGTECAEMPAQCAAGRSAYTQFHASRDDLVQRRISEERIGQIARCLFAGAGEFDRGRRTSRLGIACIQDGCRRYMDRQSRGRIEAAELMTSVEFGALATAVGQLNAGVVVAPRERDGHLLGHVESVGEIETPGSQVAADIGAELVREDAGAGGGAVLEELCHLDAGIEGGVASTVSRAESEIVLAVRSQV